MGDNTKSLQTQLELLYEREKTLTFGSSVWRSPSKLEPIDNENYEDITLFLTSATKNINEGELLHNHFFSLFESTSCLEVLDGRMDNSVDLQKNVIINAKEAITLQICPKDSSLSYEQLILFIDEITRLEVGYYMGSTFIQTMGTLYYIYDYRCIENSFLSVLFRSILVTCHVIRELILSASVYQDEDFNDYQFGLSMSEHLDSADVLKLLSLAEEELTQKIRKAQGKKVPIGVTALQENEEKELFLCEALLSRIQFRKAFYGVQINMNKRKGTELTKKIITNALTTLPLILKSNEKLNENAENFPPSSLFSPNISKRIYTSPPSGKPFVPSFLSSIKYYEEYLEDCNSIIQISTVDDLKTLSAYFNEFSKQQRSLPSRSRLHHYMSGKKLFERVEMADLVINALKSYGAMDSIDPQNPKFKEFILRFSQFYMMKLAGQCMNRARLRRKMTHHFQEIGILQSIAEDIDAEINESLYYSNFGGITISLSESEIDQERFNQVINSRIQLVVFVAEMTIDWMTEFILLGFEMELFAEHEFRCVFWYLDYLYSRLGQMKVAHNLSLKNISERKIAAKIAVGGKKGKKVKKVKKENGPPQPTNEQLLIESFHALYRAFVLFLTGIYERDGVKGPEFEFSSRSLQFFLRFSCFHHIRIPQPLIHAHFLTAVNVPDPSQLLPTALSLFKYAQNCIDSIIKSGKIPEKEIPEYKSLLRVAIANQINVIRMPAEKGRINFDFSVHRNCPIISLVVGDDQKKLTN